MVTESTPFYLRNPLGRTFGLTLSFPHLISCRKLISNYGRYLRVESKEENLGLSSRVYPLPLQRFAFLSLGVIHKLRKRISKNFLEEEARRGQEVVGECGELVSAKSW